MAERPKSQIRKSGFQNFMTSLFGWRRNDGGSKNPLEFVTVDVDSKEQLSQAIAQNVLGKSTPLSIKLEEVFESWLSDTGDNIQEVAQRRQRVDQLLYAKLNDPFILRAVQLYADEATQLDVQDRIIGIESPDPRMTKRMYEMLSDPRAEHYNFQPVLELLVH